MSEAEIDRTVLPILDPPRRPPDLVDATLRPMVRRIGI